MTIHWTFYNYGENKHFRFSISPSVADHLFKVNLAVHTPGDTTWVMAGPEYVPGSQAHDLSIQGHQDQEVFVLIEDENGVQKRAKYSASENWLHEGDVGTRQAILDYRSHFVESMGISEEHMYCRSLYEEYERLATGTQEEVQIGSNGEYQTRTVNSWDEMKKKVYAKEMLNRCESYFVNDQAKWQEIRTDADVAS